jgi:hypothetical protein
MVKDEKGDLITGSRSILAGWKKHFPQLFNVHAVRGVRQTKIRIAEPLVPEPSACEVEMDIEKPQKHKSLVLIKSRQN